MTNADMWASLVGFFLPLFIAIIQKEQWTPSIKAAIAFIACLVAAAGATYFTGGFTDDYVRTALVVFVAAVTAYKGLWQPTGVADVIERRILP